MASRDHSGNYFHMNMTLGDSTYKPSQKNSFSWYLLFVSNTKGFFIGEEADVFKRTNCLIVGKQITKLPIKAEELCVEKKYKREGPRNFTTCNKGITYCFTSRQWKNLQGQTHCYSQHNYIIFLVKVLDQLPWRAFPSNHENTGSSLLLYRLHACNTLIKNT